MRVSGLGPTMDGPFGANFGAPTSMAVAHAHGGGRLDATGSFAIPGGGGADGGGGGGGGPYYQPGMLAPRPPPGPPRKKGGAAGAHGATASYTSNKMGAGTVVVAGDEAAGPPFRSQADRRQWLLQEKRRWLVEMRLGGAEGITPPSPSKLPPIPPGGQLSNGMDLNTLVSPR